MFCSALVAGAVMFTACEGGDGEGMSDEITAVVTSINAAVSDVPEDVKVVKLATRDWVNGDGNYVLITLTPAGTFSGGKINIDLTGIVPPLSMMGGVDYGERVSDKNAKIAFIEGLAAFDASGENHLGWFRYGDVGYNFEEWACFVYADRDVDIHGEVSSGEGAGGERFIDSWGARFKKGWNFLTISTSIDDNTTRTQYSTRICEHSFSWSFEPKFPVSE